MLWLSRGIGFIPALLVTWSATAFLITYIISVALGHVRPLVPYISDTGTLPPESAIFGFMISVSSSLAALTMYVKFKIVQKQDEVCPFLHPYCNIFTLFVGCIGCIGICVVATFQEVSVPWMHDVGALTTFIFGVLYILLQTYISYKSCPNWSSRRLCDIRMFISLLSLAALIPTISCAAVIFFSYSDWRKEEKQYNLHIASATCEWVVAFGFVFFFLTYIQEFQGVKLTVTADFHCDCR